MGTRIRYWYALHPSYLIMDDIRDYTKDKEDGEENVVIDLGDGRKDLKRHLNSCRKTAKLEEINPLLAQFLGNSEEDLKNLFLYEPKA